ncbi:MAG: hypothetical protein QUT30_22040 [Acidobacteriota bacterium]|nr:hypothetical protein [Acidobacteriota bacterium]
MSESRRILQNIWSKDCNYQGSILPGHTAPPNQLGAFTLRICLDILSQRYPEPPNYSIKL